MERRQALGVGHPEREPILTPASTISAAIAGSVPLDLIGLVSRVHGCL